MVSVVEPSRRSLDRLHAMENSALVAWTSRSAPLPVLLRGFFCLTRTRGPRYGEPLSPSPSVPHGGPLWLVPRLFPILFFRAFPSTAGKRAFRSFSSPLFFPEFMSSNSFPAPPTFHHSCPSCLPTVALAKAGVHPWLNSLLWLRLCRAVNLCTTIPKNCVLKIRFSFCHCHKPFSPTP